MEDCGGRFASNGSAGSVVSFVPDSLDDNSFTLALFRTVLVSARCRVKTEEEPTSKVLPNKQ